MKRLFFLFFFAVCLLLIPWTTIYASEERKIEDEEGVVIFEYTWDTGRSSAEVAYEQTTKSTEQEKEHKITLNNKNSQVTPEAPLSSNNTNKDEVLTDSSESAQETAKTITKEYLNYQETEPVQSERQQSEPDTTAQCIEEEPAAQESMPAEETLNEPVVEDHFGPSVDSSATEIDTETADKEEKSERPRIERSNDLTKWTAMQQYHENSLKPVKQNPTEETPQKDSIYWNSAFAPELSAIWSAADLTWENEEVGHVYFEEIRKLVPQLISQPDYDFSGFSICSPAYRDAVKNYPIRTFPGPNGKYYQLSGRFVYFGEMKDGKRNGHGIWFYGNNGEDGFSVTTAVVECEWVNGKPNGAALFYKCLKGLNAIKGTGILLDGIAEGRWKVENTLYFKDADAIEIKGSFVDTVDFKDGNTDAQFNHKGIDKNGKSFSYGYNYGTLRVNGF